MNGLFAYGQCGIGLKVLAGDGGTLSVSGHAHEVDTGDLVRRVKAE
jgi:hypothetical protein